MPNTKTFIGCILVSLAPPKVAASNIDILFGVLGSNLDCGPKNVEGQRPRLFGRITSLSDPVYYNRSGILEWYTFQASPRRRKLGVVPG